MALAPIALFAFNRPDHLRRTLEALAANTLAAQSDLTIFCDGPRSKIETEQTNAVRNIAKSAQGFASLTVVERPRNLGCANSIIDGLTQMFAQHAQLIVIEDDILTSLHTLRFLNDGLDYYAENKRIFNISAWSPPPSIFKIPSEYPHDIYAVPRFNCWGWASWRDRFEGIDWNVSDYASFKKSSPRRKAFNAGGEDMSPMLDSQMSKRIDSWAIRADYWRFKNGQFGINPVRSYTTNIGMNSGTHCTTASSRYDNDISQAVSTPCMYAQIVVNKNILHAYRQALSPPLPLITKIRHKIYGTWTGQTVKNILQKSKRRLGVFIEKNQFGPSVAGLLVNPFWLSRRELYRALCKYAPRLRGKVLDFGCGTTPYRSLLSSSVTYIGLEYDSPENRRHKQADIFYDGETIPLDDASIDGLLSTQCLEHVSNPEQIVTEWARILRPNGQLLLTMPFMWPEHEMPYDFQRYTTNGLRRLLEEKGFEIEKQERLLSGCRALAQLFIAWLYDILRFGERRTAVRLVLTALVFAPISLLAIGISTVAPPNTNTYLDNVILAKRAK